MSSFHILNINVYQWPKHVLMTSILTLWPIYASKNQICVQNINSTTNSNIIVSIEILYVRIWARFRFTQLPLSRVSGLFGILLPKLNALLHLTIKHISKNIKLIKSYSVPNKDSSKIVHKKHLISVLSKQNASNVKNNSLYLILKLEYACNVQPANITTERLVSVWLENDKIRLNIHYMYF